MLINAPMNIFDLTITQLKRATAIKEQIDKLNKELGSILSGSAKSGAAPKNKPAMSASVKKKIAATQKARWTKLQRSKRATLPVKPAAKPNKTTVSATTRAKLSAKLKAFWAAKRAGKK